MSEPLRSLHRGRFLELVARGKWEYVQRVKGSDPVGIVAMEGDGESGKVILISQYRIPMGRICVEIPAGLTGDGEEANESWKVAAIRELREETGYGAEDVELLSEGGTSAGLTSECMKLVRALGVKKIGEPEPDGDEEITVHAVPLAEVDGFLKACAGKGMLIDPKVYAALYFLRRG